MKKIIVLLALVLSFSTMAFAGEVSSVYFVNNSDCSVLFVRAAPFDPFGKTMVAVIESVLETSGTATLVCGKSAILFNYVFKNPFLTISTKQGNLIFAMFNDSLYYLDPTGCVLEK